MNLKTSWISIPLLKNIIKRNTLPAKISLIIFIAFALLGVATLNNINLAWIVFGLSAVILTTSYAIFIQKYMTYKTDVTHCATLPLSKVTLWFTHYLAGLILILVPLILEAMITEFILKSSSSSTLGSYSIIIPTIGLVFIYYNIAFFTVSLCGTRMGQLIFTLAFYSVPAILCAGVLLLAFHLVPGEMAGIKDNILLLTLPLGSGIHYIQDGIWPYLLAHIIIAVTTFIGSYFVYTKRPLENTGETTVFKSLSYLIKGFIIIAVTLVLFIIILMVVNLVTDYSLSSIIYLGAVFVALIIPIALFIEMVFKNDKVYRTLLYYIPIAIICYGSCVIIANNMYPTYVDKILNGEDVSLMVSNIGSDTRNLDDIQIKIDVKYLKTMINDFNLHKDKLVKTSFNYYGDDKYVYLLIIGSYADGESDTLGYLVDKEYFNNYLKEHSEFSQELQKQIAEFKAGEIYE